jgi:hypothetical protein
MRRPLYVLLAWFCAGGVAMADSARWQRPLLPVEIFDALHSFRQQPHWVANALAQNYDGDRQGRASEEIGPLNFDAIRHLRFRLIDFNGDGRAEAVLLFDWSPLVGSGSPPPGVIMQRVRGRWHLACVFYDAAGPAQGVLPLRRRDHGWRRFRTSESTYRWRRSPSGASSAIECVG